MILRNATPKPLLALAFAAASLFAAPSYAETDAELMASGQWRDPATGLIWMRCSIGQTWDGSACTGNPKKFSWRAAHEMIKNFSYNGLSNWRIPHIYELSTIRVCKEGYSYEDDPDTFGQHVKYRGVDKTLFSSCKEERKDGDIAINTNIFPNMPESGDYMSSTLRHGDYSDDDGVYTIGFDSSLFGLSYLGSGENDGENCITDGCDTYVLRLVRDKLSGNGRVMLPKKK